MAKARACEAAEELIASTPRPLSGPTRQAGQRLPAGDDPGALACRRRVADTGEQPAQLDRGRELAALVEGVADAAASASVTRNILRA
jgi:hypothetical protein